MVQGFVRHPDGRVEQIRSVAEVSDFAETAEVWIDLETPTEADLRALASIYRLDPGAVEDCLSGEQRPRVDEFEDHVFVMMYGVLGESEELVFDPRKLAVFLSRRFLITVHNEPLKSVASVRARCGRHPEQVIARGLDFIFYSILDSVVDNYLLLAEAYEQESDRLEEVSLEPDVDESLLQELTDLRARALELRHLAISQKELLTPFSKGEYEFISESLELRFSHVRDHILTLMEMLERTREAISGVRENYHTTLATRTNAVMKVLTVFATVLLPMSVIAGIYGMNVPLWPSTDDPSSFYWILVTMAAVACGMLIYLRLRKWI